VAGTAFPLSIEAKQKALYQIPLGGPELVAIGDRYAAEGLWHDALDFYEGAKDGAKMEKVAAEALQSADLVLYINARRAAGLAPDPPAMARLKARALEMGREATARRVDLLMVPSKD
jgi:hypothetical protein